MSSHYSHESCDGFSVSSEGLEEEEMEKEEDTAGQRSNNKKAASTDPSDGQIANKETKAVRRLRIMILPAILIVAATISVGVFLITNNEETDEFNVQFDAAASEVIDLFSDTLNQKMGVLVSLGIAATAYARNQNSTWPFVTVNDFQQRAAAAGSLSDSLFIAVVPIVSTKNRRSWEEYAIANQGLLATSQAAYQDSLGLGHRRLVAGDSYNNTNVDFSSGISDKIFTFDAAWRPIYDGSTGPYFPIWQSSPVLESNLVNYNLNSYHRYAPYLLKCAGTGDVTLGGTDVADPTRPDLTTDVVDSIQSFADGHPVVYTGEPMGSAYIPVFDSYVRPRKTVAVVVAMFSWATYLNHTILPNSKGVDVVLENNCNGSFTFRIDGKGAAFLGQGDLHTREFDSKVHHFQLGNTTIEDGSNLRVTLNQEVCLYSIRVYPSQALHDEYNTNTPVLLSLAVAAMFLFTAFMFCVYDRLVERRQNLVLSVAQQTTAIVSSLFPKTVRDRILGHNDDASNRRKSVSIKAGHQRLKSFLTDGVDDKNSTPHQPIADLFPNTTVIFADIRGFTAWSSTRDPTQVFILLQTVYQAFDAIAREHNVFKVETIGDSYIAVTGLPNPQEKHAVIAARFAWDCLNKFIELVDQLEAKLGPDTADLQMRVGLHSGPCTAGVLRGERSRFQLFGDTVNTAARMESTGSGNQIQASSKTADLLIDSRKQHWLERRLDSVEAKGKGLMETYWVVIKAKKDSANASSTTPTSEERKTAEVLDSLSLDKDKIQKKNRLVDWVTDLLMTHVKKIVAKNAALYTKRDPASSLMYVPAPGKTCLDEAEEVIMMPQFNAKAAAVLLDYREVEIGSSVIRQLREVISTIASAYRDNPFHNFDHACHVAMSVDKLLNRVVTPDLDDAESQLDMASQLHDYTHGINSDPLTLLAIVFAALIHDIDHRGVSNFQLIKEEEQMASLYRNKSVAEQNSLDIAWEILMAESFKDLRACIFATQRELRRFRQMIVNVVLATDIFDKELNDLRKARWNKAFAESAEQNNNLRATIVIEHMIQASDVAHTMQHWHIYRKWNERLFAEMNAAFQAGRMAVDPATLWYQGEILFFDSYVIPLAEKLKDCNVFGVSGDEYLNYAMQNRDEWEQKGQQVVEELIRKYRSVAPQAS